MKNFEGLGLSQTMLDSLNKMDYSAPTPIQQKAIPFALDGKDILGSAQTGTGKTAAFGIPMVEKIMNSEKGCAIVLTPTRELAKQVLDVVHQLLGHKSPINTAFLIGGASMEKQLRELRANPRIIVGTPGRINDHLDRRSMKLDHTNFLVLDETDRMLDMGFGVQIDKILSFMPKKRQSLMFSATLPKEIVQMSGKYLTNPERISMGATNVVATKIKQEIIHIDQGAKYKEMVNQLYERNGSVIIFVKTKYGTERMAKNLRRDGFEADALHGDLRQRKRDQVMDKFRNKKFRILVATDIAARGLDVPHIEHVINHDLPQVAEDYIHRMGRTARAGAEGSALCFVSPQEVNKWRAIERLLDPSKKSNDDGGQRRNGKKRPPRRSNGKGAGGKGKAMLNKSRKYGERGGYRGDKNDKRFNDRTYAETDREGARDNQKSSKPDHGYDARKDTRGDKGAAYKAKSNGQQEDRRDGAKPHSKPKSKKSGFKGKGASGSGKPSFGKKPVNKTGDKFSNKKGAKRNGAPLKGKRPNKSGKPNHKGGSAQGGNKPRTRAA